MSDRKPSGRRGPLPESAPLTLCSVSDEPFDDANWIFEPKLDGLRVLCRFDGREARLSSRNGNRQDFQFPEIVRALKNALKAPALLDGEIVCLDDHGVSSFKALQQRFHIEDARIVAERAKLFPAYFYVFDALYAGRYDLRELPLIRRKEILRAAVRWNGRIRFTELIEERGTSFFSEICRIGGEGIVAKKKNGAYSGERGGDWVKIKCTARQEFVVVGYTDPKGSRVGLGALLLGYYSSDGKSLVYAGRVGTGFDTETLRMLERQLEAIERFRSPLADPRVESGPDVHWVAPKLVAEVAFGGWTQNDLLRQPRFEGLREDKSPKEVRRESAMPQAA